MRYIVDFGNLLPGETKTIGQYLGRSIFCVIFFGEDNIV